MNVRPAALLAPIVLAALAFACTTNPTIDGASIAKIGGPGNPPSCKDLCARLDKLCGVAPQDCTLADAGGYCDQYFDDTHRVCAGQAATCLEVQACANEVPDASPDVATVDAGSDSAADAEPSTDGGKDAKTD